MLPSPERQLTVLSVSWGSMSVWKVLVEILFLLFLSLSYLIRQDLPAAGIRGNRFPVHFDLRGWHGTCPDSRWCLRRLWRQQTIGKSCQDTVWVPTPCVLPESYAFHRLATATPLGETSVRHYIGRRNVLLSWTHSCVTAVETTIQHLWFYLGINISKKHN